VGERASEQRDPFTCRCRSSPADLCLVVRASSCMATTADRDDGQETPAPFAGRSRPRDGCEAVVRRCHPRRRAGAPLRRAACACRGRHENHSPFAAKPAPALGRRRGRAPWGVSRGRAEPAARTIIIIIITNWQHSGDSQALLDIMMRVRPVVPKRHAKSGRAEEHLRDCDVNITLRFLEDSDLESNDSSKLQKNSWF
jgi:hypothetical protein